MTYNDWLSTLSERDFHAHVAGRLEAPGLEPMRPRHRTKIVLSILALLAVFAGGAAGWPK